MYLTRDNGITTKCGRLLLCLLLVMLCIGGWNVTGYCAEKAQGINVNGGLNKGISVDPLKKTKGFSTVIYNNRNGLPTSEANTIAQTGEGFLWIGSYAGLIRYDGNNFERIDSTGGIANVRCLYVDSRDRLWIGTNDAGLFMMEKGEFRQWGKPDGLQSASVRAISEDEDGRIYVGCAAGGIAMIDTSWELSPLSDARLEGKTIWELRRGCDGLIYGLTQNGDLFTLRNGGVVTFLGNEECRISSIDSILPDPENPRRLYVGTEESEICYGDLENNFASMGKKDISPLSSVNRMEYINGQIWICAENGIGRLDAEGFHTLKNIPMNNSVEHVMTDYEGNLWFVSSRQGLMKIVPNQFSELFERYDLEPAVVNTTCLYGTKLFIGTDTGLTVIEGNRKAESLPLTKAVTAGGRDLGASDLLELLDDVRIRSIIEDSRGRLWITTWRKYGLLRYEQGEVTAFTEEDGMASDALRAVTECEDGSIVTAGIGGISIIRDDSVSAYDGTEDGIVNGDILTVTDGFRDELVLGSDGNGIYILSDDGVRRIGTEDGLGSEIILRIRRSTVRDGYWIVTGNSLAFMTPDYQVTTLRQFPYPNNYDIYETGAGDLWVLSSAGIYIVSGSELLEGEPVDPVFYGMHSGLPYAPTVNAYSELTADGDLYIAGTQGVVRVNIERSFENMGELKTALPFIDADGRRYYPDETGKFTLPGNAKKLTFYPYVFSYSLTDPQVSYRLEGFDQEDISVSRSRLVPVDYTNLKLGAYRFLMTVKDPVGHDEHSVSFRIVKGKEISAGTIGTLIMIAASLILLGSLLIFTSLYRKRGHLEDRLFFSLILSNLALAVGESLSYLLELSSSPLTREMMILGNTVFYIFLVFFPYLLLVYLQFGIDPDKARVRKFKLLYGIPCALVIAVMLFNLKTGWIFTIADGNVFRPGPRRMAWIPVIPVWFYFLVMFIKMWKADKRVAVTGLILVGARLVWDLLLPSVSSISFIYSLILVAIYLDMMGLPLNKEAP
ncbi:MAG: histidine kinase [Lachnospiraceae bacterium]|nr:histidine kinase [Lachnospiraceae bacterium]